MRDDRGPLVEDGSGGKGEQTRHRLIEAALALFAENGFRGTSTRDIAAGADANVAAVNYHFGSKELLYHAVLETLAARFNGDVLGAVRDVMDASEGHPTVEAVLEAAARGWGRSAANPAQADKTRLVDRELFEPRAGLEFLVEHFLEPLERELGAALQAARPEASARTIQVTVHLFLGQLSHLKKLQLHLAELGPARVPLLDPDRSIDDIVRFTSAGFNALVEATPA